jgi:hypothetical protein
LHEKMDLNCCSLAGNLALRQPFQKVSATEWNGALVAATVAYALAPVLENDPLQSSESFPFESPGNLQTILRI